MISLAICEAICLSTCQSINLYFSVFDSVSFSLSVSLSLCQSPRLTICISVYLTDCLSLSLCVSLSLSQCVSLSMCQSSLSNCHSICKCVGIFCLSMNLLFCLLGSLSYYVYVFFSCMSVSGISVFLTTFFYISVSQSSYPSISLSVNLTLFLCV